MNRRADTFPEMRAQMVQQQLAARGIIDEDVLDTFSHIPRELFVPRQYRQYAYDDTPLPIPENQTISQPYIVAYMLSLLQLKPGDCVLEIGTGSGYAAALLSRMVRAVYTVERHEALVLYAQERLARLDIHNVQVRLGDGTAGWAEHAPYDGIIVAAGGPAIPHSLKQQLTIGGRLVMPVGRRQRQQWLELLQRRGGSVYETQERTPVAFVPLIGKEGWEE